MRPRRPDVSPYRLYLFLESGTSFLLGISYATITVYWVTSGRLNPLQLLLLGTSLELSYFLFQLPTGVLADLVSRRLCILTGLFILGLAQVLQSLSPSFLNLMIGQAVLGFGYALNNGAQGAWIADELSAAVGGDDQMTGIYLRATQLGLVATVAGSLLSGVIALAGLDMPLRVGGALLCLLALAAAVVLPERNFRPAATRADVGGILRQAGGALAEQTRSTHRAVVAVPGLVLLFGMTFFVGMWSESFDRLWGAFLLRDIRFPQIGGLHPAMWFSLFACVAAVLGLGSTELAKRRTQRLGPNSVVDALLVLTLTIAAAVVALATAHAFVVVVVTYVAVSVLRPVLYPLASGWMVGRIDSSVRATALSAWDMFDSAGQMIGGPVVGVIGTLASLRIALLAGAAALGPAAACIAAASRRIRPTITGAGATSLPAEQSAIADPKVAVDPRVPADPREAVDARVIVDPPADPDRPAIADQ